MELEVRDAGKALAEQLPTAVKIAVHSAVNGKVKALSEQMKPMADAYNTWISWRRTVLILFGVFLTIGAFINSVQAMWTVIAKYVLVNVK